MAVNVIWQFTEVLKIKCFKVKESAKKTDSSKDL